MADTFVELLRRNYNEKYGETNVRPALDQLLKTSRAPFDEVSVAFKGAEPRWQLPLLEAMRILASTGYCNETEAEVVLRATETVATDSGEDEYFKSVNALVVSPKTAPALTRFISRLLERPVTDDFSRRLAFYTVGMLVEHGEKKLATGLHDALSSAAATERSDRLKLQFQELLKRLY